MFAKKKVKPLRPFFSFFGGKWTLSTRYPAPAYPTIVEPFAGSAGYSTRFADRDVILVEREPVVASLWRWLISVSVEEVMALPLDPEKRFALRPEACALIGGLNTEVVWTNEATSPPTVEPSTPERPSPSP